MPEGQIDSLSLFFYFVDSAGLHHAPRLFELLASSYEQCVSNRLSRTQTRKEMTSPQMSRRAYLSG
jgi:hypothetical protein